MQHELLLDCGAPVAWAQSFSDVPGGPGDRHRQRVPRRAAGAPVRAGRRPVAGADGAASTRTAISPSTSPPTPEPYIRRQRGERRDPRSEPVGHRFMFELGAPAREAGRRGAPRRLRPFGDRLRRHAAGAARASLCRSARRAGRMRPHRPCRFRRDGAQRRAPPGPRSTGRSTRATSCARSASTSGPRRSPSAPDPERAEELQHTRDRLVGKGKGEMGALFKAMARRQPQAAAAARLPAERGKPA